MGASPHKAEQVVWLGLGANGVFAVGKLLAGIFGHSYALIADALESGADVLSSLIVLAGVRWAQEPADHDHPYGHGRAETLAAAVVALFLFGSAIGITIQCLMSLGESLPAPHAWTLLVLLLVVAGKEGLFQWMSRKARLSGNPALRAEALHHRSDAVTSCTAAVGILLALLGGPAFRICDNLAALVAASWMVWMAQKLLRAALHDLMDGKPDERELARIRDLTFQVKNVRDVEKIMVRKLGSNLWIDLHVEVDETLTVKEGHEIAHEVKDHLRAQLPEVLDVLVHIEPFQNNP